MKVVLVHGCRASAAARVTQLDCARCPGDRARLDRHGGVGGDREGSLRWRRGSAPQEVEVTAEQSAASKTRVCKAVTTVTKAVQLQTFANLGPDPVAQTAVAANARLALFGGGAYLLDRIDEATPPELAEPIRKFGETLQDIGMNALTGVTNEDPVQQGRLAEGDQARQDIAGLCA